MAATADEVEVTGRPNSPGDRSWSTIVVGAGAAGLATARSLARRGRDGVLVLEAESTPAQHSSGLNAAIHRTMIEEQAVAELARRSLDELAAPYDGGPPLTRSVGLILTADREESAERLEEMVRRSASRSRPLSANQVRDHWPLLRTDLLAAWLAPDEGVLDIGRLVGCFAQEAAEGGVEIRCNTAVERLSTSGDRVDGVVLTDGTQLRAEQVVLAAGGWIQKLARTAGSTLEVSPRRRHLLVTSPTDRIDPAAPVIWNLGDDFYARPESGGLLLCACDESEVEPDRCAVDPTVREAVAGVVERHLPEFVEADAAHFWCGMRTFAEDKHFRIGPDPDVADLFWVGALGGHGMTTAPAVGELAADVLENRGDATLRAAFDPARALRIH